MIIGVPKEVKNNEFRVGIVPSGVKVLISAGHRVIVERNAGEGSGINDAKFSEQGGEIAFSSKEVYEASDLIMKVKEPISEEWGLLREGQVLFCFLHLAPFPKLAHWLLDKAVIGVAYETVQLEDGLLPLLKPMSEVAGKMSVQVGAHYLQRTNAGRGILLGGVPGVQHGMVTILGAGVVGVNAAKIAYSLGARINVIDKNLEKLTYVDDLFGGRVTTLVSEPWNIEESVIESHLVVGGVLVPGARAPVLVREETVKNMKEGAVIVDCSVDQGGCIETIKPTTHSNPTYIHAGVIHYGVTNMPSAFSRTSTFALTSVTFPYALKIAQMGIDEALRRDKALARGTNVYKGKIVHPSLAESLGMDYTPLESLIQS